MHEVDHLKSRFFANISHEFRTPLTLILGPLDKLLSREANQDKPLYQIMQRNAKRLLDLVNQLLDLSKLEAGNMRLENKPASIITFLKAVVLSFSSLAESKQIQFQFKYPTEDPVLYFDADKLEKILTNLLSNAFKFTPIGGEITVSSFLLLGEDHTPPTDVKKTGRTSISILELKVQDNGAGISNDQLKKIFDRFYQTDTSATREHEGSGIGLALVRELVDLHGGEITVETQPGVGACFTVRLPLVAADFEQLTFIEKNGIPDEQSATRFNDEEYQVDNLSAPEKEDAPLILIVEDNADMRHYICKTFSDHYKVIEAANGKDGITKAEGIIPDLIISDIMMPEMDGYKFCERIKTNELTCHIPVILLTAKADRESKLTGLETRADDYLSKPFDSDELKLIVRNRIEERRKMRERFRREITLEPKHISVTSLDEKFITKVLAIIEDHMDDETFSIDELGREGGYSKIHFYRKIKALTGQTPSQFVRTIRLKRAAELLSRKSDNISQIAYQVGFSNISYFNKCFKDQFEMTPGDFVKTNQIKN